MGFDINLVRLKPDSPSTPVCPVEPPDAMTELVRRSPPLPPEPPDPPDIPVVAAPLAPPHLAYKTTHCLRSPVILDIRYGSSCCVWLQWVVPPTSGRFSLR
ncbi:hypothetical protein AALP_AA6G184300 [Arabis alpina]|uniref:Uncharacterized protein n=1 Tax=Arabis alpina TaxID=50452 RepID=A0A087GQ24_ARAAL|nr:hypothetical protein AALP_AA6G184300 [Arabis alpina]